MHPARVAPREGSGAADDADRVDEASEHHRTGGDGRHQ